MEIIAKMKPYDQEKYDRAKKKVEAIKGFHSHLITYIVINIFIIIFRLKIFPLLDQGSTDMDFQRWVDWNIFLTPLLWGIGLAIHGIYVYKHKFGFLKRWEERKIREIMEEEERSRNKYE